MALIYNGVTIPSNAIVKYGSTTLQKVIYAGVTVWQKQIYDAAFKAVSPELTSKTPGNFFKYATITCDPDYFSFSNGYAYCQRAGTYTITLIPKATAGASEWHGTVYVNGKVLFACSHSGGHSQAITLSKGDYIYCNSPASGSTNGYLTVIIK